VSIFSDRGGRKHRNRYQRENEQFVGARVNPHRLYRSENRILAGVAAGIAEYLGLSVTGTRLVLTLASFPFPIIPVIYAVLIFILPRQPRDLYETPSDEAFWRTTALAPSTSFSDIRYRFRDMEERVRSMESYVTSAKYEFERELRRSPPPM
jgi:phage shock protein C